MYIVTSGEAEMSTLECQMHPEAEGCQIKSGNRSMLGFGVLTWAVMFGAGYVIWKSYKRRQNGKR